jgi:hypothetical protein
MEVVPGCVSEQTVAVQRLAKSSRKCYFEVVGELPIDGAVMI